MGDGFWTDRERAHGFQWYVELVLDTIRDHGDETRVGWIAERLQYALDEYGTGERAIGA